MGSMRRTNQLCVEKNRCGTCCKEANKVFLDKGFTVNGMVMAQMAAKKCLAQITSTNSAIMAQYKDDAGKIIVCDINFPEVPIGHPGRTQRMQLDRLTPLGKKCSVRLDKLYDAYTVPADSNTQRINEGRINGKKVVKLFLPNVKCCLDIP